MDIEYAKDILIGLADGVNPLTGEVLPEADSCNQIEIVRALNTVLRALDGPKKVREKPANAGKVWTEKEDALLCEMYDSGAKRMDMSVHFKRSSGAIAARLVRLGKIETREDLE